MLSGSSTNATGLRKPMVLSDDALARLQSSLRPTSFLAPLLNPRSFKPRTTAPPPTLAPLLSLHKRKVLKRLVVVHRNLNSTSNSRSSLTPDKVAATYQDRLAYLRAKLKGAFLFYHLNTTSFFEKEDKELPPTLPASLYPISINYYYIMMPFLPSFLLSLCNS
jgi:hypothetical protein